MGRVIERDGVYGMTSKDLRELVRQLQDEVRTISSRGKRTDQNVKPSSSARDRARGSTCK